MHYIFLILFFLNGGSSLNKTSSLQIGLLCFFFCFCFVYHWWNNNGKVICNLLHKWGEKNHNFQTKTYYYGYIASNVIGSTTKRYYNPIFFLSTQTKWYWSKSSIHWYRAFRELNQKFKWFDSENRFLNNYSFKSIRWLQKPNTLCVAHRSKCYIIQNIIC